MEFIKKILGDKGLILVILVAASVRLLGIGLVPYGIANDEASYIMSGYEIAKTGGYDIAGNFLPLSINLDSSLSPVPVYIIALFVKLFGISTAIARLPFALMGIGIVVTVYFLCKELFQSRKIAFLSALALSFSSWHILVTRTVWDVIPAQLFYLLGLLIFLKKVKRGSILWSLPFFLLGFYSYHGTKVFFACFILILLAIFWKKLLIRKKELIAFLAGIALIFISFAIVLKTESVTRQEEIIFSNNSVQSELKKSVEFDRAKSSAPHRLVEFESNKLTFYLQRMATNYLGAFSSQYLFTTGDIHPLVGYGVFFKGVLYLIDIPFILLGLIYLIEKSGFITRRHEKNHEYFSNRVAFTIILGGLLLSPLPSTIAAGNTYFIRSFMMTPFLAIVIGIGWYVFWNISSGKKYLKIVGGAIIILLYCFFTTRFFYQYYYQLNTYGSEYWNASSRQLSEFIVKNQSRYDNVIIGGAQDKLILQYALVSRADPLELGIAWRKKWPAYLGNVKFADSCYGDEKLAEAFKPRTLYVVPAECHEKVLEQEKITDSLEPLRVIWKLYEN